MIPKMDRKHHESFTTTTAKDIRITPRCKRNPAPQKLVVMNTDSVAGNGVVDSRGGRLSLGKRLTNVFCIFSDFWRRATLCRQKSKKMLNETLAFFSMFGGVLRTAAKNRKKCLMKTWHSALNLVSFRFESRRLSRSESVLPPGWR